MSLIRVGVLPVHLFLLPFCDSSMPTEVALTYTEPMWEQSLFQTKRELLHIRTLKGYKQKNGDTTLLLPVASPLTFF